MSEIQYYIFAAKAFKFTDIKSKTITLAVELPYSRNFAVVEQDTSGEVGDDVIKEKEFKEFYKPNEENTVHVYRLANVKSNEKENILIMKLPYTAAYFVVMQDNSGEIESSYYKEKQLIKEFKMLNKHHLSKLNGYKK